MVTIITLWTLISWTHRPAKIGCLAPYYTRRRNYFSRVKFSPKLCPTSCISPQRRGRGAMARAPDCLASHACVPVSNSAVPVWGFKSKKNSFSLLNVTRRSRWWRPRRVKVETSVSTLFSRRAPRCALLAYSAAVTGAGLLEIPSISMDKNIIEVIGCNIIT